MASLLEQGLNRRDLFKKALTIAGALEATRLLLRTATAQSLPQEETVQEKEGRVFEDSPREVVAPEEDTLAVAPQHAPDAPEDEALVSPWKKVGDPIPTKTGGFIQLQEEEGVPYHISILRPDDLVKVVDKWIPGKKVYITTLNPIPYDVFVHPKIEGRLGGAAVPLVALGTGPEAHANYTPAVVDSEERLDLYYGLLRGIPDRLENNLEKIYSTPGAWEALSRGVSLDVGKEVAVSGGHSVFGSPREASALGHAVVPGPVPIPALWIGPSEEGRLAAASP